MKGKKVKIVSRIFCCSGFGKFETRRLLGTPFCTIALHVNDWLEVTFEEETQQVFVLVSSIKGKIANQVFF